MFVQIELHCHFIYWLYSIPVFILAHVQFILPIYVDRYLNNQIKQSFLI